MALFWENDASCLYSQEEVEIKIEIKFNKTFKIYVINFINIEILS